MNKKHLLAMLAGVALAAGCGQQTDDAPDSTSQPEAEAATVDMGDFRLPASSDSAEALEHYLDGWRAWDVASFPDTQKAHAHFMKAAEADPSFAMAHLMVAISAPSTEGFTAGLEKAVAAKDGASESEQLIIEGVQKNFDGDAAGWLDSFAKAAELNPESPRALGLLGFAQAQLNMIAESRATIDKAIALNPDFASTQMQAGVNYMFQEPKDFDRAEEHFRKATELVPGEMAPYDLLGDVLRAKNDLDGAYAAYTQAAEVAPEMGGPLQQRAHVSSFMGNFEEARADYTRAAELEDARGSIAAPGFLLFRAFVALHEGNPDAAVEELTALAGDVAESGMDSAVDQQINILTSAVQIATHYGDAETANALIAELAALIRGQAESIGTEAFRNTAESNIAWMNGMLAARMGDSEVAAARAAEFENFVAAETNPRKLEGMHEILGMAAFYQDDFGGAVEHLSQGDVVNNEYVRYYLALAHEGAGNSEAARALLDALAVWNFNSAGYAMTRGDILARTGG